MREERRGQKFERRGQESSVEQRREAHYFQLSSARIVSVEPCSPSFATKACSYARVEWPGGTWVHGANEQGITLEPICADPAAMLIAENAVGSAPSVHTRVMERYVASAVCNRAVWLLSLPWLFRRLRIVPGSAHPSTTEHLGSQGGAC